MPLGGPREAGRAEIERYAIFLAYVNDVNVVGGNIGTI
jgi:hypothetical protein